MERRYVLNQFVAVGRIAELPVLKETGNGIKFTSLLISCKRAYPNNDGDYEHDLICVTLWRSSAEECVNTAMLDGLVGIKGRLQSSIFKSEEGKTYYNYEIIAEKVSFMDEKQ